MRRRQFATLGVTWPAFLAFPNGSRAQQLPRIGWLSPGGRRNSREGIPTRTEGIRVHRPTEFIVEYHSAEGHYDRIGGLRPS